MPKVSSDSEWRLRVDSDRLVSEPKTRPRLELLVPETGLDVYHRGLDFQRDGQISMTYPCRVLKLQTVTIKANKACFQTTSSS